MNIDNDNIARRRDVACRIELSQGQETLKANAIKYDDDDALYAVNMADRDVNLNSTAGLPDIMKELRQDTNEILVRQAQKSGQSAVKIAVGGKPPTAKIRGYATFLSFIKGSDLPELEQKLGFKSGVLQLHGAYVYHVDGLALTTSNIAPRGNTDWSAGLSPRDLYVLSNAIGAPVGYHREYPPAAKPIPQFIILAEVPFIGPPRFVKLGDVV